MSQTEKISDALPKPVSSVRESQTHEVYKEYFLFSHEVWELINGIDHYIETTERLSLTIIRNLERYKLRLQTTLSSLSKIEGHLYTDDILRSKDEFLEIYDELTSSDIPQDFPYPEDLSKVLKIILDKTSGVDSISKSDMETISRIISSTCLEDDIEHFLFTNEMYTPYPVHHLCTHADKYFRYTDEAALLSTPLSRDIAHVYKSLFDIKNYVKANNITEVLPKELDAEYIRLLFLPVFKFVNKIRGMESLYTLSPSTNLSQFEDVDVLLFHILDLNDTLLEQTEFFVKKKWEDFQDKFHFMERKKRVLDKIVQFKTSVENLNITTPLAENIYQDIQLKLQELTNLVSEAPSPIHFMYKAHAVHCYIEGLLFAYEQPLS